MVVFRGTLSVRNSSENSQSEDNRPLDMMTIGMKPAVRYMCASVHVAHELRPGVRTIELPRAPVCELKIFSSKPKGWGRKHAVADLALRLLLHHIVPGPWKKLQVPPDQRHTGTRMHNSTGSKKHNAPDELRSALCWANNVNDYFFRSPSALMASHHSESSPKPAINAQALRA